MNEGLAEAFLDGGLLDVVTAQMISPERQGPFRDRERGGLDLSGTDPARFAACTERW